MIKLSNDQLLASGFVKIFMDIVQIFKNIILISWLYDTILIMACIYWEFIYAA